MKIFRKANYSIFSFVILIVLVLPIFGSLGSMAQVTWKPIGPGGGGWLTAITIVDDSQNTVYVGCDVGGIYKSTNHGKSWEIKDEGLSIYFVHDIEYNPQNPETLYLATRGGIYKSINGGDNWQAKRNGFPPLNDYHFSAPISDILVDPNNSGVLYAGVGVPNTGYDLNSFHWQSVETKGSIYKSFDDGESWEIIRNKGIDTTAMIFSMDIDPKNSNIIYASTSKGLYKSFDAANSWISINAGLPHHLCMKIIVHPVHTGTLYVTLWAEPGSDTWQGGVYKSINGGASWCAMNNGLPGEVGNQSGLTCNYPALIMDKKNPEVLYTGNIPWTPDPGVYKTIDGGGNWEWVSRQDPPNANVDMGWIEETGVSATCLAINPVNSNNIYFGTSMHLFKTDDAGEYWNQVFSQALENNYWHGNGFETTVSSAIVVDPKNSNNLYAGYWDIGLFKSRDGGFSFKKATTGMRYNANTFDITIDPENSAIIYAASGWWEENQGEVYKSVDSAENWIAINNGLPDAQVWSIALDKNSPPNSRTLYATSYDHGIYKTTDGGQSWVQINNGLGVDGNLQVRKIVIDPNNSQILYVGIEAKVIENGDDITTIQGGIFKSVDAGNSWTRIDSNTPQLSVWDIDIEPSDSQVIYTSVSSEYDHSLQIDYTGGVYKSTDGGMTWEMMNTGFGSLQNLDVSSIVISPVNHHILYATTTDSPYHDECNARGVFKSINAGESWQAVNTGLGVHYLDIITIDPSDPKTLYAGSAGNGLQKGIDAGASNIDHSFLSSSLQQIHVYPNPFLFSTRISFHLFKNAHVSLCIYDLFGNLISYPMNDEYLLAGEHSVIWHGQDERQNQLVSGTYLYTIISEDNIYRGKLIIRR